MRMTEQIDALEVMAIDSRQYLVSTRLLAAMITVPLITALFSLAGIGAAFLLSVTMLGQEPGVFWGGVERSVEWADISLGLEKSFVFAALIATISCYRGYHATGGATGVGPSDHARRGRDHLAHPGRGLRPHCTPHVGIMVNHSRLEISVGAFVAAGLAIIAYLAISLGNVHLLSGDRTAIVARFSSIGDLRKSAPVRIAGVNVGQVGKIELADYVAQHRAPDRPQREDPGRHDRVDPDRRSARRVVRLAVAGRERSDAPQRRRDRADRAGARHHPAAPEVRVRLRHRAAGGQGRGPRSVRARSRNPLR